MPQSQGRGEVITDAGWTRKRKPRKGTACPQPSLVVWVWEGSCFRDSKRAAETFLGKGGRRKDSVANWCGRRSRQGRIPHPARAPEGTQIHARPGGLEQEGPFNLNQKGGMEDQAFRREQEGPLPLNGTGVEVVPEVKRGPNFPQWEGCGGEDVWEGGRMIEEVNGGGRRAFARNIPVLLLKMAGLFVVMEVIGKGG